MSTQQTIDFDAPPPAQVQAELSRDLGITRAASRAHRHAPGWEDDAVEAVRRFALTHETFIAEDARATIAIPDGVDGRAFGAVMQRARREGLIRADGYAPANSSNRSPKVRWRSLVFTGSRSA